MSDEPASVILSEEETVALKAEYVQLLRYDWPEARPRLEEIGCALAASDAAKEQAAMDEFRARMTSLRAGRRAADIPPGYEKVIVHLDGDPHNNDLDNLRVMDLRDNGGQS